VSPVPCHAKWGTASAGAFALALQLQLERSQLTPKVLVVIELPMRVNTMRDWLWPELFPEQGVSRQQGV